MNWEGKATYVCSNASVYEARFFLQGRQIFLTSGSHSQKNSHNSIELEFGGEKSALCFSLHSLNAAAAVRGHSFGLFEGRPSYT